MYVSRNISIKPLRYLAYLLQHEDLLSAQVHLMSWTQRLQAQPSSAGQTPRGPAPLTPHGDADLQEQLSAWFGGRGCGVMPRCPAHWTLDHLLLPVLLSSPYEMETDWLCCITNIESISIISARDDRALRHNNCEPSHSSSSCLYLCIFCLITTNNAQWTVSLTTIMV